MSWVRVGDTLPTAAPVLRLEPGEQRARMLGFVIQLAALAAGNKTDAVVTVEMARQVAAPDDHVPWVKECVRVGLLERVPRRRDRWLLCSDESLIHVRSNAEMEWERRRKRENGDQRVTMPVKRRDGDACRYCGVVVHWRGTRVSRRAGTYDHRDPAQPASADTMVVSCLGCNSQRGGWQGQGLSQAQMDDQMPLLPVPSSPFYSEFTATQLSRFFGVTIPPTKVSTTDRVVDPRRRPGGQPEHAVSGARPASLAENVPATAPTQGAVATQPVSLPGSGSRTASQADNAGAPEIARTANQAGHNAASATSQSGARPSSQDEHAAPVDLAGVGDEPIYLASWDELAEFQTEFENESVEVDDADPRVRAGPGPAPRPRTVVMEGTARVGSGRAGSGRRAAAARGRGGRSRKRRGGES